MTEETAVTEETAMTAMTQFLTQHGVTDSQSIDDILTGLTTDKEFINRIENAISAVTLGLVTCLIASQDGVTSASNPEQD